jgi:hypothetical protein
MWRHQEQVLAGLASGSFQRTADSPAFVTERLRRLCALQRYRLTGASPFSAERPIWPWSFVARPDATLEEPSGVIARSRDSR